jgi:hypothetical protein
MHEVTNHGLNCWSRSLFEKLGWMLLAYTKGFPNELKNYIENIKDVHTAIKEKINNVVSEDTKNDLVILKENIESLMFFSTLLQKNLDEHYSKVNSGERRKSTVLKKNMKSKLKKDMNN